MKAYTVIAASGDDFGGVDISVLKVFSSKPTMKDFNSIKKALINSRFNIHGKFTDDVIKELIETWCASSGSLVIEESEVSKVNTQGVLPTLEFDSVEEIIKTGSISEVEKECFVDVLRIYEDYDNEEGLMYSIDDEYSKDPRINSDELFFSLEELLLEMEGKYFNLA